jgi:phytoene synthase
VDCPLKTSTKIDSARVTGHFHGVSNRDTDQLYCERVSRTHARTFALASRLLPAAKRRAAFALYAFCRIADDLVDSAPYASVAETRAALAQYQRKLDLALIGRGDGPVFREVARVVQEYGVPGDPLHELLDGVARDLKPPRYSTWDDLESYCQGVASSVGEMCTYVFGMASADTRRSEVLRYARTLGVAMQLTNILRDVGEDVQRQRCYLPESDLALFDLTPDDVLTNARLGLDDRFRHMMVFEIARARSLYRVAAPGIAMLARDAQGCASACATGYAGILTAIEQQEFDTISSRARVGRLARVGILWGAWRFRPSVVSSASETGLFWEEPASGPPGSWARRA